MHKEELLEKIAIQEKKLKEFAQKHNLKINPKYTFRYWAWLTASLGRCPCKPDRLDCPCSYALQEVKEKGFCFCKFFMSEEYYNEFIEFYKKRGKTIKKKEAPV